MCMCVCAHVRVYVYTLISEPARAFLSFVVWRTNCGRRRRLAMAAAAAGIAICCACYFLRPFTWMSRPRRLRSPSICCWW